MEVNMLRKVSTLSIAGALIAGVLVSTPAYAAVSNGSTCTVVNKTVKVSGFTYRCVTAVMSTVTLEGTKTTIYLPAAKTAKNAKRYYLAVDCITETAAYAKSVKDLAALETSTAKALVDLDAQIAEQVKANDSKAKLATLRADTVNATKNAVTITKLSTAISQLSSSITSLKTSNSTSKIQMQSVNSSISKYNSSIMQLKSTTNKNLASIENSKKIGSNITALNKTKDLTAAQLVQAKDTLKQNMNSRNLICSKGL